MDHSSLMDAVEALLSRSRDASHPPTRDEIDELYTDGCAGVLTLEAERLRVKRRLADASSDRARDPHGEREARELADRDRQLDRELAKLTRLVKDLKVAAEWMRDPEAAKVPASGSSSRPG